MYRFRHMHYRHTVVCFVYRSLLLPRANQASTAEHFLIITKKSQARLPCEAKALYNCAADLH